MRVFIFCILSVFTNLLSQGQNIGIGLNNPSYPLTVQANSGNASGITQKNATVELGFYTSSASAYLQTWSPHDLNFATNNGVARLTLAHSTGFLGVNTIIPTAQFDVNGTFRLRGNGAALGRVLVSDASGGATWQTISTAGAWSLSGNAGTVPDKFFGHNG